MFGEDLAVQRRGVAKLSCSCVGFVGQELLLGVYNAPNGAEVPDNSGGSLLCKQNLCFNASEIKENFVRVFAYYLVSEQSLWSHSIGALVLIPSKVSACFLMDRSQ